MFITIAIFIGLTIAVAAFALVPRHAANRVIYDAAPDGPVAFGYKMSWIAIKTADTKKVLAILDLYRPETSNWGSGIGTVYHDKLGESRIFVAPPVRGWTLVAGLALPQPMGPGFVDRWTPLMQDLAAAFGEVQYYFSYPLIDFYAWARARKGKITRAFAIGDEGIILKRGRITKEEKSLGLKLFELRGVRDLKGDAGGELVIYPTERHVMRIAGKWGLDPTRLDAARMAPGLGYVGFAPAHWRPKRHAKAA